MDSIQSLRLFTRVVELGSFSAAAREENTGQPTISKVIAALERKLGVRLLERTTTSLTLTDEGARFYERSKRVIEEYADAVADVRGQTQRLAGTLLVNAPVGLGELRLNALLLEFLATYPEIEIELVLNDRVIDLIEEGVDVAIRLGDELPPHVVARHIASSPRVLVATPEYIKRSQKVRRPEDLAQHEYIRYAGIASGSMMEFSNAAEKIVVATTGRYRVNSSLALRQCFLAGIGLGTAPAWLVQDLIDTGALVQLLPKWQMASQAVHLVYPSRKYQPLRTRTLLQFLAGRVPHLPGLRAAVS
ncbi:LysR family transcriptional regulator [Rugamonas sp. CCM 8940]|uniref:LysR family transcriptional regulator n=1 Tax=Rugamonas sp. CCM 8940 TaxID=2765359 RepID=UPI0018F3A131|nr:LysR family transcriptional regulator [Rugamonas sp. CCM 8940]MBJ7313476.1 LysR family transcriptional regulator [Rugamonas sp. CCM 8940]